MEVNRIEEEKSKLIQKQLIVLKHAREIEVTIQRRV